MVLILSSVMHWKDKGLSLHGQMVLVSSDSLNYTLHGSLLFHYINLSIEDFSFRNDWRFISGLILLHCLDLILMSLDDDAVKPLGDGVMGWSRRVLQVTYESFLWCSLRRLALDISLYCSLYRSSYSILDHFLFFLDDYLILSIVQYSFLFCFKFCLN